MMSISINGWETNLKFSAAHFIPHHEKCKRLHGHDYAVDIVLSGDTKNGMVADFVAVKKAIRKLLEDIDHKLILPEHGVDIKQERRSGQFFIEYEGMRMSIPEQFVYLCDVDYSSSEELSRYLCHKLIEEVHLDDNVKEISLSVYEGPGQKATWSEKL